jgi:hypothetical protein
MQRFSTASGSGLEFHNRPGAAIRARYRSRRRLKTNPIANGVGYDY